jgi:hypothetical protein
MRASTSAISNTTSVIASSLPHNELFNMRMPPPGGWKGASVAPAGEAAMAHVKRR